MLYTHFYHHLLAINEGFSIWSFDHGTKQHKVKAIVDDHQFTCYCPEDSTTICNDLNFIASKWQGAPVIAHDEVTATPPSWRKIEVGKYVKVQDLLQVATFTIMVAGAIVLHRAGVAAQSSVDPRPSIVIEEPPSRPMSLSEMSQLSSMEPPQIVPKDASIVQIEGESIHSLNVSIDSQTFRDVSLSSHSLSGLSEQVTESFANTILIAPELECEMVANIENTFSESMYRPKSIDIGSYNGEFANPLTNKFCKDVNSGKVFFENVLQNEPQLSVTTKDMVHAIVNDIEVNGALNKNLSKQVIATVEKEIGGFKIFTNFTGSAKPPVPPPPSAKFDPQYYQATIGTNTIGSITQTTVDQLWKTAVTEIQRETLLQTSLDTDLIQITAVQHAQDIISIPRLSFNRTNAPFIGHPCLIFDILNDSVKDLPPQSFVLMVDTESYLVRGIFDHQLWVYCNRSNFDKAEKHCRAAKESQIVLVPQKRRKYTFWMHGDVKLLNSKTLKIHPDVISVVTSAKKIWVLDGALHKRQCLYQEMLTVDETSRQLTSSVPLTSATFCSLFQFNGIETIMIRDNVSLLPPVVALLPYNFVQVCTYDTDYHVTSASTITVDYKNGDARGFMAGNDYIHITQKKITDILMDKKSAAFRTVSFFSSYDFTPIRIRKIVFNRPWVIYASFWYMRIELESEHGIEWSQWSKRAEEGFGANPAFTMDILGDAAKTHLAVAHRCRLRIYSVPDNKTLIFTTTEKGDESKIHPSVFESATLGFPLDENMSAFEQYKTERNKARTPMLC